jgi:hypothetical protein
MKKETNLYSKVTDHLNLRSEVVQDIIQTEPIWIVRSGIIMWFVMVITIFVALSFIPYHYKIELDIKIKSYQSDDLVLSVKRKEIIYDVIVEDGADIKAGDTLILLEDYSKISRAKQLRKLLGSIISNALKSTRHYQTGNLPIEEYQNSINEYFYLLNASKDSLLFEKNLAYRVFSAENLKDFIFSCNHLQSKLGLWFDNKILIAPFDGTAYYSSFLEKNKEVTAGQELVYVSKKNTTYYGEILVPSNLIGKIKYGQKVNAKISSEQQSFGILKGEIYRLTNIRNEEGHYPVFVEFNDSTLTTDADIKLTYNMWRYLRAEILLKETTLLSEFSDILFGRAIK